jgi:hypothetical protein
MIFRVKPENLMIPAKPGQLPLGEMPRLLLHLLYGFLNY